MKNLFFILAVLAFISCNENTKAVEEAPNEQEWIFNNTTTLPWKDRPIIINRDKFQLLDQHSYFEFLDEKRNPIPYQLDDLDGDGKWDEAFLLLDAKAKSKRIISAIFVDEKPKQNFKQRTNIRFGKLAAPNDEISSAQRGKKTDPIPVSKLYQMEGPAWENDHVAFRNYFDMRNGMDIFGKLTTEMVLDSVGLEGTDYHAMSDWGMDVLKVGNSLGAGAIALKKGEKIYRIGEPESSTYELISDGPLRAIFNLNHKNFKIADHSYDIKHQISIWGGSHFYQSQVTVNGLEGDEQLVTGIVNLKGEALHQETLNKYQILATHGPQAENKANLGMGLLIPSGSFIKTQEAPQADADIVSSYMALMRITDGKPVTFYFYSGWENQDAEFKNKDYFLNIMKKDVQ